MSPGYLALLPILAVINFVFVFLIDQHIKKHKVRPIYDVSATKAQRLRELHNAIVTTPVHALLLGGFLVVGILRPGTEGPVSILLTFAITFIWTELWHYGSHVALHTRALHFIHREHHRSHVTNPWSSVSFSFLEKFIFSFGIIGFMSILSHFMNISVYGIAAYYLLYFFTNTLGHGNVEIRKPGYSNTFLGRIFNTPAYHAIHHARYVKNYGLLTPILDNLYGTCWEDSNAIQERAARGRPLESLKERC